MEQQEKFIVKYDSVPPLTDTWSVRRKPSMKYAFHVCKCVIWNVIKCNVKFRGTLWKLKKIIL